MYKIILVPYFILVYFTIGIAVNFLQLCILPLFWINRHAYQILTNYLAYCLFSGMSSYHFVYFNKIILILQCHTHNGSH